MKISYAIAVKDELEQIQNLIQYLFKCTDKHDEVVVLYDEQNGDPKVWEYLNLVSTTSNNQFERFKIYSSKFYGHFANWKNYLNFLCTGDYIFNIDADEIPNSNLIDNIHQLLTQNTGIDLFLVPRVNTVEGITDKHIQQWKWTIDNNKWINWPDYQGRIYRNDPKIFWEGKVHETIKGINKYSFLPQQEEWALYHPKDIQRQEKQNNLYSIL